MPECNGTLSEKLVQLRFEPGSSTYMLDALTTELLGLDRLSVTGEDSTGGK